MILSDNPGLLHLHCVHDAVSPSDESITSITRQYYINWYSVFYQSAYRWNGYRIQVYDRYHERIEYAGGRTYMTPMQNTNSGDAYSSTILRTELLQTPITSSQIPTRLPRKEGRKNRALREVISLLKLS